MIYPRIFGYIIYYSYLCITNTKTNIMNEPNKTHTSTGLELSQLFIGDDGKLSVWTSEHEVEVVGAMSTPFGDGWCCKIK